MDIETFLLERNQTLYENEVEFNLTESGVHPCTLRELFSSTDVLGLMDTPLGYGYTDGRPKLRESIATWYPRASAGQIAVTHGTSEANVLSVLTALSAGDEILVFVPNFMQIPGLLRALGVHVRTYELREENSWQPDLAAVEACIGSRTRMIALANPNNPTGQVLTEPSMRGLIQIIERHGLYLLADEIYRGAEIDLPETPTFYGMSDRVIVTSSLSKAFALPGLRLGWVVAPDKFITEVMRRQDYTSIGTGILNQLIAERALEPQMREQILARTRRTLSQNIRVLTRWLEEHEGRLSCRPTQAGAMAFVRYPHDMTSEEFSRRLRVEESVFVVAGSWFGIDRHVRIGIGGERDALLAALVRIDRFLERLDGKR